MGEGLQAAAQRWHLSTGLNNCEQRSKSEVKVESFEEKKKIARLLEAKVKVRESERRTGHRNQRSGHVCAV